MYAKRIVGIFVVLLVVAAALILMWYIGSQKTVYDVLLSYGWQ